MTTTSEPKTPIKAGVDLARVRDAITPVLGAHKVTLVDLLWLTERAGWTLRVTIERLSSSMVGPQSSPQTPPGLHANDPSVAQGMVTSFGVTLEDCSEVSRDISSVLDVTDLIPHRYHLEVSSPGLDRPLKTEADFVRFVGHTVKVKLTAPAADGQRVLRGTLTQAGGGSITVEVDDKPLRAALTDVAAANLVFEMPSSSSSSKKPNKTKKKQQLGEAAKKASPKR